VFRGHANSKSPGIINSSKSSYWIARTVFAGLDAVCKSLGITYEEWFETALIESEYDVLTNFLISNS